MKYYKLLLLVLLLVSGVSNAYAEHKVISNAVSADGVLISYSTYGDGDVTLVFIHGWSCDSRYWYQQIPCFSKKYKVITIDIAGHGNSGTTRKDYTMEKFGQDVASVLKKTDTKKAILIGHSMGGGVILQAALLEPERVIGLIGVDTLEDISTPWTQEQINQAFLPIKADFRNNTNRFVRSMFREGADSQIVDAIAQDMSSADSKIAINSMAFYLRSKEYELIKKIKVPLKSVNADLWPTNEAGNKKAAIDYELYLMKNCGHFLMIEKAEEFNSNLEKAVKSIINYKFIAN